MGKIKSFEELQEIRDSVQTKMNLRVKGDRIESLINVRVGMATCGIASGARETMREFVEEFKRQGIDNAVVTQTGCMGYCHSEPTVEVLVPGREPVVFGNVDKEKVKEIINKYIKLGELIDGIIPTTYKTID